MRVLRGMLSVQTCRQRLAQYVVNHMHLVQLLRLFSKGNQSYKAGPNLNFACNIAMVTQLQLLEYYTSSAITAHVCRTSSAVAKCSLSSMPT